MHTTHIRQRQSLWFTVSLAAILAFILAACSTNTATGGPTGSPTFTTVKDYGAVHGCPSDAVVSPEPAAANVVLNMNQSSSTITAHSGNVVEVHLPFGQLWRGPSTSQGVLSLQTPAGYALKDKNVCAWRFVAQGTGTTELSFTGRAICKPGQVCPQYVISVPFTIKVQ